MQMMYVILPIREYCTLSVLTIFAPVIYMAQCIVILMRASTVWGGAGPGTLDICGPCDIAQAARRVRFGAGPGRVPPPITD